MRMRVRVTTGSGMMNSGGGVWCDESSSMLYDTECVSHLALPYALTPVRHGLRCSYNELYRIRSIQEGYTMTEKPTT